MSSHDKVRLEKGQLALLGPARIEVLTDNELAREVNEIGYALAGIQSTDDPSPEYGETEDYLLRRLKELDDERRRRSSTTGAEKRSREGQSMAADVDDALLADVPREPSMWDMLNKLAGNPDYAVCVMAWPWPDGGWMAGIALTDRGWAERQGMSPAILRLEESVGYHGISWNMFDGFARGINAHSTDGPGAVKELLFKIAEIEKFLKDCDGTCSYCTGTAPLAEAPHCVCACAVHALKVVSVGTFEPPKVTLVGNMHDLLQNVCTNHDEEPKE